MENTNDQRSRMWYKITCGLLLFVALFLTTMFLGGAGSTASEVWQMGIIFGAIMIILSVYEFIVWICGKGFEGKVATFRLIRLSMYLVAGILSFFAGIAPIAFSIGCIIYLLSPVARRVASVYGNHLKRNIIVNVIIGLVNLFIFVIGLSCLSLTMEREAYLSAVAGLVLIFTCLMGIGVTVLSSFNLKLLKKIVRKTFAGEILFGLLLLILSFSVAITSLEPSITDFGDALWYCFAIVTTIGFGDLVATSIFGRLLSVILGIYGIIVVSIVTSIIVNFYSEVKTNVDDEDELENGKADGEEEQEDVEDKAEENEEQKDKSEKKES